MTRVVIDTSNYFKAKAEGKGGRSFFENLRRDIEEAANTGNYEDVANNLGDQGVDFVVKGHPRNESCLEFIANYAERKEKLSLRHRGQSYISPETQIKSLDDYLPAIGATVFGIIGGIIGYSAGSESGSPALGAMFGAAVGGLAGSVMGLLARVDGYDSHQQIKAYHFFNNEAKVYCAIKNAAQRQLGVAETCALYVDR